jgi:Ca2+-binding EF-hand superfamily protein
MIHFLFSILIHRKQETHAIKKWSNRFLYSTNESSFSNRKDYLRQDSYRSESVSSNSSNSNFGCVKSTSDSDKRRSKSKKLIITERLSNKRQHNSDYSSYSDISNLSASASTDSFSNAENSEYNELSEDDLEFILNNTGFSKNQIYRWHDDFMNKCKKGYVTFDQFSAYYSQLIHPTVNENSKNSIIEMLFRLFDIDGDCRLSFSEFIVSFWIRVKAPTREKYTWVFNMFDTDRNGSLSYAELKSALSLCLNLNELDKLLKSLSEQALMSYELSKSSAKYLNRFRSTNKNFDIDSDNLETDSDEYDTRSDTGFSSSLSSYDSSEAESLRHHKHSHKSSKLLENKLNKIIMLMSYLSNPKAKAVSSSHVRLSNLMQMNYKQRERVQIEREKFLDLCENSRPLRKLLVPISYFYESNVF